MIFVCVSFTECAILSAITCQRAFLIAVSSSAGDAVLPDIAINTNKIRQINKKNKMCKCFANTIR